VTIKPGNRIRRFDVFAEFRKQEEQAHGMPADQAKDYGLWVAKVVAARKFGRLKDRERLSEAEVKARRRRKWRVLSGEPQTDKLFDHHQILKSAWAPSSTKDVFVPAIRNNGRQDTGTSQSVNHSAAAGGPLRGHAELRQILDSMRFHFHMDEPAQIAAAASQRQTARIDGAPDEHVATHETARRVVRFGSGWLARR
jgi:hypothetical protein